MDHRKLCKKNLRSFFVDVQPDACFLAQNAFAKSLQTSIRDKNPLHSSLNAAIFSLG